MKKIVFDLDGTLLNSKMRHQVVLKSILDEQGIALDLSDFILRKMESESTLKYLLAKNISKSAQIADEWQRKIEETVYLNEDIFYPDVLEMLEALNGKCCLITLTARSNEKNLQEADYYLRLKEHMERVVVVSPKMASTEKANFLGDVKNDCLCFIGDTESDYEAAMLAGVIFVAVSYGFRSSRFWKDYLEEKNDCDTVIVNSVFDLKSLILNLIKCDSKISR